MVRNLKAMLRAYEVQGLKWWKVLAACERSYNDSINKATGFTPFYMNFGRHPYQHAGTMLQPIEEQFVAEFVAEYVTQTQSELARVHDIAADRMLDRMIKETARRNAKRSPTIDYHVGQYVYLETSALKKSHSLAPLRSGPFQSTEVTSNGNYVYLEGFRHPFNVEIITPTITYRDGSNPHLTKHDLDKEVVTPVAWHLSTPNIEAPHQQDAEQPPTDEEDTVDIDIELENTELPPTYEEVMEILDEDEEIWGREPLVRIVPSSKPLSQPNIINRIPSQPTTNSALGILTGDQKIAESDPNITSSGPTGSVHTAANIQTLDSEEGESCADNAIPKSQPESRPVIRYL
jgi:hypothetical protein